MDEWVPYPISHIPYPIHLPVSVLRGGQDIIVLHAIGEKPQVVADGIHEGRGEQICLLLGEVGGWVGWGGGVEGSFTPLAYLPQSLFWATRVRSSVKEAITVDMLLCVCMVLCCVLLAALSLCAAAGEEVGGKEEEERGMKMPVRARQSPTQLAQQGPVPVACLGRRPGGGRGCLWVWVGGWVGGWVPWCLGA